MSDKKLSFNDRLLKITDEIGWELDLFQYLSGKFSITMNTPCGAFRMILGESQVQQLIGFLKVLYIDMIVDADSETTEAATE